MITLDELAKAYDLVFGDYKYKDGEAAHRAAIAAVVRALEPVIEQAFKFGAQYVSNHVPDYGANDYAKELIRKILAPDAVQNLRETYVRESPFGKYVHNDVEGRFLNDQYVREFIVGTKGDAPSPATDKVLGEISDKAKPETSPASFCEWFDGHCDDWEHDHGVSSKAFFGNKSPTHCHHCNKPIKFMAGETAVKAVGEDLSLSHRLSPVASFCEWKQIAQTNHYVRSCNGDEQFFSHTSPFSRCHNCKKPIKLMADASTRKDEGTLLVDAGGVKPSASSAAIIEETLNVLYGGGWKHNISAEAIEERLLSAGYKILSREPTEGMVDAVTLSPSHRILVKQDWRKQWDAAK